MNETQNDNFNETFRALVAADAEQEAPPRIEAALLTAFRQQHQPENAASQPTRGFTVTSLFARWQPKWRFALAATVLLFATFAWWNWRAVQVTPAPKPEVAVQSPAPTQAPMTEPALPIIRQSMTQVTPTVQLAMQRKPRRAKPPTQKAPFVEEEIATEFFPLVTQDALPERGQLRRVKVPRSTLVNFGLPMNVERIEIPINADLLVGEDGAARAIRFVQDRFPSETFINNGDGKPISAAYRKR